MVLGELWGKTARQGLGDLVDQIPMIPALGDAALLGELWAIANEVYGWASSPSAATAG